MGGARYPWLAAHIGEGNPDNIQTGRRGSSALVGKSPRRGKLLLHTFDPRASLYCPSLLSHVS